MRTLAISDMTLKCASAKAEQTLSFREKLEIAKLLDKMQVSVLETPPIVNEKVDSLLIKSIAGTAQNSIVCVPVPLSESGIAMTWDALKEAAHPRMQVSIPTSPVQMEYQCHKKPPMILSMVSMMVAECKKYCADVEFVADDATRAVPEFLQQVIAAAIEAGASTVTVADSAGVMLPEEFAAFIQDLYAAAPAMNQVCIGAQCSNELGMAIASASAAIRAGVGEIKVSAICEDVPSLDGMSQFLRVRADSCQVTTSLQTTQLQRSVAQIKWIATSKKSKTSPFDLGVQDQDANSLYLSSFDDISAVSKAVKKLGYDLSDEDMTKVFEEFVRFAQKKNVGAKELDAIVASAALQVPATYQLISYVINCGNVISATANIQMEKDGKRIDAVCIGDGSIDAAFLAIEQIVGRHFELDDFQIQSVTEGREAMGSTLVKLRSEGKLYSGKGISTDIVGASIRAYLNALNKIVYEES